MGYIHAVRGLTKCEVILLYSLLEGAMKLKFVQFYILLLRSAFVRYYFLPKLKKKIVSG